MNRLNRTMNEVFEAMDKHMELFKEELRFLGNKIAELESLRVKEILSLFTLSGNSENLDDLNGDEDVLKLNLGGSKLDIKRAVLTNQSLVGICFLVCFKNVGMDIMCEIKKGEYIWM
jgi:hypothetical protein